MENATKINSRKSKKLEQGNVNQDKVFGLATINL